MNKASFSEVEGLRGLLKLADEDPAVFEQIRGYQKHLSERRNVGSSLEEYRAILLARLQCLHANHRLFSDSATTVLRIIQDYEKGAPEEKLTTTVLGMVTYDLNVGPAYTDAEIWDLFVPAPLRDTTNIPTLLIEYCHDKLKRLGVTSVRARLPHKRTYSHERRYLSSGYIAKSSKVLEFRFKSEG